MVDDIIGSESHTKEGTGWMKVTRHTGTTVHILTNTLQMDRRISCQHTYMYVENKLVDFNLAVERYTAKLPTFPAIQYHVSML